jgi:hypothetical protein
VLSYRLVRTHRGWSPLLRFSQESGVTGLRPAAYGLRPSACGCRPSSSAKLAGTKRDSCIYSELLHISQDSANPHAAKGKWMREG